ncbi:hypothetical protein [Ammoniphilus sp. CFH 90114]|uniref:hypothetical protein n=1 Tax=Ammoniphilus sp. CFH 90114 TaxID=2493665 RepID=UPI0013E91111|nr:hypothetical protein [Ammoniphilus sp. CFH 90114]
MPKDPKNQHTEPTIAPGLDIDELEEDATDEEVAEGDYTSVTKLFLDRTPDE